MTSIESYRDLIVWQRSVELAEHVYLATRGYPTDERFGLTSQSRRAAVSVAANIAEGYGRGSRAAYASFLRIARGSLKELETHVMIANRLSMISADDGKAVFADCDEIGRMLNALLARLARS